MPDERVVLRDGETDARVTIDGEERALPLFVGRAGPLPGDGVLLREGHDRALVRVGHVERELPLWRERPDGAVVRVRVKRIAERQR